MSPQSASRMAASKLQAFAKSGAAVVVSASPLCTAHLLGSHTAGQPSVMGIFEFMANYFRLRAAS